MVEQLRRKPEGGDIPVTIGDMTSATASTTFSLVYLVWNAIMNVTTQDEQIAVFATHRPISIREAASSSK